PRRRPVRRHARAADRLAGRVTDRRGPTVVPRAPSREGAPSLRARLAEKKSGRLWRRRDIFVPTAVGTWHFPPLEAPMLERTQQRRSSVDRRQNGERRMESRRVAQRRRGTISGTTTDRRRIADRRAESSRRGEDRRAGE